MRYFFLILFWAHVSIGSKDLYYIAVCASSRSAEEVEMALELSSKVLVVKCEKQSQAFQIRINAHDIEVSLKGKLLFKQKKIGESVTEIEAKRFASALLRYLEKPVYIEPKKAESQTIQKEEAAVVLTKPDPVVMIKPTPAAEARVPIEEFDLPWEHKSWQLESLGSVDHWNYQIATKAYPGFQIAARWRFIESWELGLRGAL